MLSKKNKVILTILAIVTTIVILVVIFNKFSVVRKIERFVDDDNTEEGEEEEEEEEVEEQDPEEEEFVEPSTTSTPSKVAIPSSKDVTPSKDKKDVTPSKNISSVKDATPSTQEVKTENAQPIDELSAQLKKVIEVLKEELSKKNVSTDVKSKIISEFTNNTTLDTLQKIGGNTNEFINKTINRFVPPKDTYADAPVMMKSVDKVKMHIRAALKELEGISSMPSTDYDSTATKEKFTVNERFSPSREAPKNDVKPLHTQTNDVIEGFENTAHYALY
jgi:hypothetical protein